MAKVFPITTKKKQIKKSVSFKPVVFHPDLLATDIITKLENEKLTFRKIADSHKIDVTTMYRAKSGQAEGININSIIKIINFLEQPISKYFF